MPPNTVYVGRPTIWGNPFCSSDPALAVRAYRLAVNKRWARLAQLLPEAANPGARLELELWACMLRNRLSELRGKNLACWCPLDKPCHADVLLQMANKERRK